MALSTRFMPAFLVVLDKMARLDYFAADVPDQCGDGHPYYWSSL
jgi:hypothetical protein